MYLRRNSYLLQVVDINKQNNYDETALMIAALTKDKLNAIKELIAARRKLTSTKKIEMVKQL